MEPHFSNAFENFTSYSHLTVDDWVCFLDLFILFFKDADKSY